MRRRCTGIALAAAALLGGVVFAAPSATVRLPVEREVPAARPVVLGAIAQVEGETAGALASLEVSPALGPGRERVISRARIERLAARAVPGTKVTWTGAESVRLRAAGVPLEPDLVRERLLTAWKSKLPPGHTMKIGQITIPARVLVPAGPLELSILSGDAPVSGTRTIRVELRTADGWTQRVPVRVRLEVSGPMLVATRDLRPGDVIGLEDVVVRQGVLPARRRVVAAPGQAVGLSLRAFVRAGEPVTWRDLDRPDVVEPGQPVVARLRRGAIVLTLDTVARSRGDVGDVVRVRGLGGRGVLEARVLGPGLVEIVGSREEKR